MPKLPTWVLVPFLVLLVGAGGLFVVAVGQATWDGKTAGLGALVGTAVGTFGAFLVALWTIQQQRRSAEEDRQRALRASRAMLSAALDALALYAEACTRAVLAASPYRFDGGVAVTLLPVQPKVAKTFRDCMRHADGAAVKAMAQFLQKLQVTNARSTRALRGETGPKLSSDQASGLIFDIVDVCARMGQLFRYARNEEENPRENPTLPDMMNALMGLRLPRDQEEQLRPLIREHFEAVVAAASGPDHRT